MVHDMAIVTMADQQKVVHLLNGVIFNDLGWPLTHISRERHYSTFNIVSNIANIVIYVITKDYKAQYVDGA